MDLNDKLSKYLGMPSSDLFEELSDDDLMSSTLDFLLELDDSELSDEASLKLHELLSSLDVRDSEDDEGELSEKRMLKRTSSKTRRLARMYYKKHKNKIKMRLRKLAPKIERLERAGRGLSGKRLGLTKRMGTKQDES